MQTAQRPELPAFSYYYSSCNSPAYAWRLQLLLHVQLQLQPLVLLLLRCCHNYIYVSMVCAETVLWLGSKFAHFPGLAVVGQSAKDLTKAVTQVFSV